MTVPTARTTPAAGTAAPPPAGPADPPSAPVPPHTSIGRRLALGASTLLAVVLPASWGITSGVDLLTGTDPWARFYQLTGQGVLLAVLWLGALVPVALAGWRRRRPPVAAALVGLAVMTGVVLAGILAPGNGGGVVAIVVVVTGALLWAALPVRPALGAAVRGLEIDPLLAPLGLLVTALLTPYALRQASRQRTLHDEFARASHYYDMAWLSLTVVALVLLAGLLREARVLAFAAAGTLTVFGAAGLALLSGAVWPVGASALGIALGLASAVRSPRGGGIRGKA